MALRRKDDPPEDLIEKALRLYLDIALQEAICDLTIARAIWRKHRELVEALVLPEPYCSFDDSESYDSEYMALSIEQLRLKLRPQAMATARRWSEHYLLIQ